MNFFTIDWEWPGAALSNKNHEQDLYNPDDQAYGKIFALVQSDVLSA